MYVLYNDNVHSNTYHKRQFFVFVPVHYCIQTLSKRMISKEPDFHESKSVCVCVCVYVCVCVCVYVCVYEKACMGERREINHI